MNASVPIKITITLVLVVFWAGSLTGNGLFTASAIGTFKNRCGTAAAGILGIETTNLSTAMLQACTEEQSNPSRAREIMERRLGPLGVPWYAFLLFIVAFFCLLPILTTSTDLLALIIGFVAAVLAVVPAYSVLKIVSG